MVNDGATGQTCARCDAYLASTDGPLDRLYFCLTQWLAGIETGLQKACRSTASQADSAEESVADVSGHERLFR